MDVTRDGREPDADDKLMTSDRTRIGMLLRRALRSRGSNNDEMVELWGFEPQTPSMRTRLFAVFVNCLTLIVPVNMQLRGYK